MKVQSALWTERQVVIPGLDRNSRNTKPPRTGGVGKVQVDVEKPV